MPMPLTRSGSKQAMDVAAALLVRFGDADQFSPTRRRSARRQPRVPGSSHPTPTPTVPRTPKRLREPDALDERGPRAATPPPPSPSPPSTPLDLLAGVADRVAVGRTHTPPACAPTVATTGRATLALCDVSNAQAAQTAQTAQAANAEAPGAASERRFIGSPATLPPGFLAHAFSSVHTLVSALETAATRPLLCDDDNGGRIRTAALDEMFRSAPIAVVERVCPRWRTDETTIRALAHYDRHDILTARREHGVGLAAIRPGSVRRNEAAHWCEVVLVTSAAVATVEAAEGLGLALHDRAIMLQRAVEKGGPEQALRAFSSTLSLYGRGSAGGRMLDALAPDDVPAVHACASRHHASLCALAATGAIERAAAANFVLALLERATASAKALECFRRWTEAAYGASTLNALLLALQANGAVATEISRVVGCLATVRAVDAYAWVEKRAVDGEWLHTVFSSAGRPTSAPWSAWGATCTKCDAESRGKAPIVAIATLVTAVGLESTGQTRGAASNEVVRLALGSLIAWLSDVARHEEAEESRPYSDLEAERVGPVAAEVTRWVAALLWKIASRGGALIEAATRDVADDARARGATPPSMKILEGAMAPMAFFSPVC